MWKENISSSKRRRNEKYIGYSIAADSVCHALPGIQSPKLSMILSHLTKEQEAAG